MLVQPALSTRDAVGEGPPEIFWLVDGAIWQDNTSLSQLF